MKFLGIDLAWTQNNESGVIALERDGSISGAGWTVGTSETLSWMPQPASPNVGVSANRKLRPVPAYDLRTPGREVRGGKHGACDDLRRATR